MISEKYLQIVFADSKITDGNMSFLRGDPKEVLENRRRFLEKLGINLDNIIAMSPQHGINIERVRRADLGKGAYSMEDVLKVDGLITNEQDVYLFLIVADCHPIAIFDPKKNAIGLVHAGWIGLDKGIVRIAVEVMHNNFNSDPKDLLIEFGPSIGPCCYRKLDSLQQKDNPRWKPYIFQDPDGTYGVDLWRFAVDSFLEIGVTSENIQPPTVCNYHSGEYFSHRRVEIEGGNSDYRFATVFGIK